MRRCVILALLLLASLPALAGPSEVRRAVPVPSAALGRALLIDLYLPPDIAGMAGLPVIYLLHGTESSGDDWLDKGDLRAVADRLIQSGALPRAVIVMPDAANSWYVDSPPHAGPGAMGTAIARDLPEWVEGHFPVSAARDGRAVAGYSMGGFGALRLALAHPDRYVAAVSMSGAFWTFLKPDSQIVGKLAGATQLIFGGAFGDPFEPRRFIAESPFTLARDLPESAPRPAVLLISGRNEIYHMREEQDAAAPMLRAAAIPLETELTDGDHDWDNWRQMLPRVLQFLGRHLAPGTQVSVAAGGPHPDGR